MEHEHAADRDEAAGERRHPRDEQRYRLGPRQGSARCDRPGCRDEHRGRRPRQDGCGGACAARAGGGARASDADEPAPGPRRAGEHDRARAVSERVVDEVAELLLDPERVGCATP